MQSIVHYDGQSSSITEVGDLGLLVSLTLSPMNSHIQLKTASPVHKYEVIRVNPAQERIQQWHSVIKSQSSPQS